MNRHKMVVLAAFAALAATGANAPGVRGASVSLPLHAAWLSPPVMKWVPSLLNIRVPLPLGSRPSVAPFPNGTPLTPMVASGVEVASAEYAVPLSAHQIPAWYNRSMSADGFVAKGSGYIDTNGQVTWLLTYGPKGSSLLQVNVAYVPLSQTASLVAYWVTDILRPARPTESQPPHRSVRVVAATDAQRDGRDRVVRRVVTNPH